MTVTSRKGWRKKRAQIEMDAVHLGYFLERNENSRRETIGVHRTLEKLDSIRWKTWLGFYFDDFYILTTPGHLNELLLSLYGTL